MDAMDGQPVWLASVSYRVRSKIRATGLWSPATFRKAERVAHAVLADLGDETRERAFRMNATFCVHRALTPAEVAELPVTFHESPGGEAGPPVEVLWSRGIPHRAAAMPCERPSRLVLDESRPDLWIPGGCGACAVCVAWTAAVEAGKAATARARCGA